MDLNKISKNVFSFYKRKTSTTTRTFIVAWTMIALCCLPAKAQGPGGVSADLKLWLRADDETSILRTVAEENYTTGTGANIIKLEGYGSRGNYVEAVREWNDPATGRNHNRYYVRTSASTSNTEQARQRNPIYRLNPLEMNYHPAVQFWGIRGDVGSAGYGAYLSNAGSVFNTSANNPAHTAIFVVNNNAPLNGDRSYYMTFGNSQFPPNGGDEAARTALYGVKQVSGVVYPSFNTRADQQTSASNASNPLSYTAGSTAIMSYRVNGNTGGSTGTGNVGTGSGRVIFGLNGSQTNEVPFTFGAMRLDQYSMMGVGYEFNRQLSGMISEVIMFQRRLEPDDLELVEAYLGAKYGITLYGKTRGTNFNYKMSGLPGVAGSTTIYTYWPGQDSVRYREFHNNVAVIIKDSGSNLDNRQSHSTDVGSMLHIGVGGVPNAKLDINGASTLGTFAYDNEVVAWGHNVHTGTTDYFENIQVSGCNRFESLFKRRWLVRKATAGNRPIELLVGLQNNSGNNLGRNADAETDSLYKKLVAGNEVFMIVAKTQADLDSLIQNNNGEFIKAVIPMTYLNGEFQCNYTFTDTISYITFGVKTNTGACEATKDFAGTKTLDWYQYDRNSISNPSINIANKTNKDVGVVNFNLGDGITGSTHIVADGNIQINRYYPRSVTSPAGGIHIQRNRGNDLSKVRVTIDFADGILVKPSFRISDIDIYSGRNDKVKVTGSCPNIGNIAPKFSTVSNSPSYRFEDAYTVVANKTGNQTATGRDGSVDVAFEEGVNTVVIEYYVTNGPNTTDREIYISPLSLTSVGVLPPPVVRADGISFAKSVREANITTCEPAEYSFYITNNNYGHKWVNFADTLPTGLTWEGESLVIDSIGFAQEYSDWKYEYNANSTKPRNVYAGQDKLRIDSLYVPCNSTLKLSAVALIDTTYAETHIKPGSETFANYAAIDYDAEVLPGSIEHHYLRSVDRQTTDPLTRFTATYQQRQDTVLVSDSTALEYAAGKSVTVKLKVTNNNAPIDSMFLNVNFDAGFTYVSGTYSSTPTPSVGMVYRNPDLTPAENDSLLIIAGSADGQQGFTLPTGTTEFTFILLAPAVAWRATDAAGLPIAGSKSDLTISYEFVANQGNDPCLLESMNELSGEMRVPCTAKLTNIIINRHVTLKLKK